MSPSEPSVRRLPVAMLVLAAATVALDQYTKHLVVSNLSPGQRQEVFDGWFQIWFILNPGGLFGAFRDLPEPWRIALFSVVPLIASVGLLFFLMRTAPAQWLLRTGLALILGGAVGNLIDRIRLGQVIDFLDVYWRDHHWPAFNIADASICVGVGLILVDAFGSPGRNPDRSAAADEGLAPDPAPDR